MNLYTYIGIGHAKFMLISKLNKNISRQLKYKNIIIFIV